MRFITLFLLLNLSLCLNAQITIRNEAIVEKPVLKPKVFDSLTNLTMQRRFIDYKKYIGYKLFYIPESSKSKPEYPYTDTIINFLFIEKKTQIILDGKMPFEQLRSTKIYYSDPSQITGKVLAKYNEEKAKHDQKIYTLETDFYQPQILKTSIENFRGEVTGVVGTCKKCIEGNYFTILDILASKYSYENYVKLEDIENELDWRVALKIILKDDATGDTLYWKVKMARDIESVPFVLVPYFEKQKKLYQNKNLVAMSEIRDLVDINTGEIINIKPNEKWDCYDVTFIETKKFRYLRPYYFLRNGNKEIVLDLGVFSDKTFILESEFLRREAEKKKKEEELLREQLAEQKKIEEERKQFVNYCTTKFGAKSGALIADGKVVLGMSKEMCKTAWGEPIDINKTILKGLTNEQWVYGYATYLYFDNGVLSGIQN